MFEIQVLLSQRLNDMLLASLKSLKAARSKELLASPAGNHVAPPTTNSHPIARSIGG